MRAPPTGEDSVAYPRLGKQTVNAVRFVEVVQVFARHGFADLVRRAGLTQGRPAGILRGLKLLDAQEDEPATFGVRLRQALIELGPTFVKFGQILSTRPDLVTHAVAEDLSLLQDQVPPLPFERIKPVIREELGDDPENLFSEFDPNPIASASISLVYRATLPTGEPVAVKVQRPNITRIIESDLGLMRQIAGWIAEYSSEARIFDPPGIVDAFARSIRRELDFGIEARIIERFREHFAETEDVTIPEVYYDYSGERVLTMAWIDGDRIDRLAVYPERNCDPAAVSTRCAEALFKMVFEDHLFHADPHPGNLFVTRDNGIAFLDLGMAGHLERTDVAALADLMLAIFQGDAKDCIAAVLALTVGEPPEDLRALEQEVAEFIAFEARGIVASGQVAKGLERSVQILHRHGLELGPRFTLLLKALATIEVVARTVDPDMDVVGILQPYIEKFVLGRFQPLNVFKEIQANASGFIKLGRQAPGDLSHILQQTRRGRLRFHIHNEQTELLAGVIDRASSRTTVGVIVAALIVGSSLLITVESRVSHLGLAMFLAAGLLGLGLVFSILWYRKF